MYRGMGATVTYDTMVVLDAVDRSPHLNRNADGSLCLSGEGWVAVQRCGGEVEAYLAGSDPEFTSPLCADLAASFDAVAKQRGIENRIADYVPRVLPTLMDLPVCAMEAAGPPPDMGAPEATTTEVLVEELPAEEPQEAPPFFGELPDGSPCLKSPAWDVLPTCEERWNRWREAAGDCAAMSASFRPECRETLLAVNEGFDWGDEICQGLAFSRSMLLDDPAMQAEFDAGLIQLHAMPSCDGKTRAAPVVIEEDDVESVKKDNTTMYLSLAVGAIGIGVLVGVVMLTARKG